MLKINNLVSGYGSVQILNGSNMEVKNQSIVALLGGNGTGKSTILKACSGIIRAWKGTISFNGEEIQNLAPHKIVEKGSGIIVYLRQEGRGIGIENKIKAYKLQQEKNLDTVEANNALGFKADLRDYGVGAQILKDLGAKELIIMTNNPKKLIGLEGHDLKISERLPVKIKPSKHNEKYLSIKKTKLDHLLD